MGRSSSFKRSARIADQAPAGRENIRVIYSELEREFVSLHDLNHSLAGPGSCPLLDTAQFGGKKDQNIALVTPVFRRLGHPYSDKTGMQKHFRTASAALGHGERDAESRYWGEMPERVRRHRLPSRLAHSPD